MKMCKRCGVLKDIGSFYKLKDGKGIYYTQGHCKKCHVERSGKYRKEHHEWSLQWNKEYTQKNQVLVKKFVDDIKKRPCFDCKKEFPVECMDFDHLPSFSKVAKIAFYVGTPNLARKHLINELAKCELVCVGCHRIRTRNRVGNLNALAHSPKYRDPIFETKEAQKTKKCVSCFTVKPVELFHKERKYLNNECKLCINQK